MIKSPKSSRGCFMFHRAIVADRVVERLRDRLSSGALFFVDLIFAHGVFFTFRVCHARDLACELVNGGGPPVGLYGKVASNSEDCGLCFLYIHWSHILQVIRLLIPN